MTHTITVGEAINLINNSILDFEDGLSQETINKIVYSINNEIQVRDYLLGIADTFSMDTCKSFLTYLSVSVEASERYSLETILSAYYFEAGNKEASVFLLSKALEVKPAYSLALLLERVIKANWPANSFATMRKELHPKVIAGLEEMKDQLIGEVA